MKLRIVVFEDTDLIRNLLVGFLKKSGFEVFAYESPAFFPVEPTSISGTDKLLADVLITDNSMPEMTGIEFLQQLIASGNDGRFPERAIISGSLEEEDLVVAAKLNCRLFGKPFVPEELLIWLKECEKNLSPDREMVELQETVLI